MNISRAYIYDIIDSRKAGYFSAYNKGQIVMLDPSTIDYRGLGFQAGLEIHHQLRSTRKLFCHCPAELDPELQKEPEYVFHRRFRAVMGEMGDFDPGMLVEVEKGYLVIYHANDEHVCTYEMDETPPFWPDEGAIETGFHISRLFNCESPVEEIVVNRKQYLDGSITTGFQRTMIIARDGYVELLSGKKVPITNILIEEDAARKIRTEQRGRTVYYNLDRLGIPLTEIITDHRAIDTPEVLVEAARMIGLSLRANGLVKRGKGTVRQDVNLSISGGNRVEIKGIQDLAMLPRWCAHEVCRQHSLIRIGARLNDRQVKEEDLQHTYVDISQLFNDLADGESACVVRLPSFADILSTEVQPGKDFGFEIFEKCSLISGIQYDELFHSGELGRDAIRRKNGSHGFYIDEGKDADIRNIVQMEEGDGYIAARGPTKRVHHAMQKIIERCRLALHGVPQETRRALENGNSEFLRVVHGKERLYPDTDTPPMPFLLENRQKIWEWDPIQPLELLREYEPLGLSFSQVSQLIRAERVRLFGELVKKERMSASLAFFLAYDIIRHLKRTGHDPAHLTDEMIREVGHAARVGELTRSALPSLLEDMCGTADAKKQRGILKRYCEDHIPEEKISHIVREWIEKNRDKIEGLSRGGVIGSIMKEHDRMIDGRKVAKSVEGLL